MRFGARVGRLAAGLIAVVVLFFALPFRLPGGIEAGFAGGQINDPVARLALRDELHDHRALPIRFFSFVGDVADGDLGHSPVSDVDVGAVVGERVVESVAFAAAALAIAWLLTVRRRVRARVARRRAISAGGALPSAVLVLPTLVALAVATRFGGLPTSDPHAALVSRAAAGVLPALALGTALAIWSVMRRPTPRDLVVAVTIGTLVSEAVFGLPGIGALIAASAAALDPMMTRGALLATAIVVVIAIALFLPVRSRPTAVDASARVRATRGVVATLWIAALVVTVGARRHLGLAPAASISARGPRGLSPAHPFGTDVVGRDVLARVLATARGSLLLVVAAIVIAAIAGAVIGGVLGFAGGRFERVGVAALSAWATFPGELLALAFLAFNGRGGTASALALGLVALPALAAGAQRRTLQAVQQSDSSLSTGAWLASFGSRVSFGAVRSTLATVFVGAGRVLAAEIVAGLLGFGPAATQTWSREISTQLPFAAHAPQAMAAPLIVAMLTAAALVALGNAVRPVEAARQALPQERASEASGAT